MESGSVRWLIEPLPEGDGTQREREQALAYRLMCRLLGEEQPRLEHDGQGAPFLPGHPQLCVTISHCHRAVAVAVAEGCRVGIDVECRRKVGEDLMVRVCTTAELEAVRRSADATMAFLQLWTRKEAVLKMRGTGIRGFDSMVHALDAPETTIQELPCSVPDTVASIAFR